VLLTSASQNCTVEAYTPSIEVFCSYAHRDEELKNLLLSHLAPMRRSGLISAWHDGDLSAGEEWQAEIEKRLNTCEVILLLISPDFFASDFCYGTEMQRALERYDSGDAVVIPIIVRPCDWHSSPVGRLQVLPPRGRPVTSWSNPDEAMEAVAKGIRKSLNVHIGKDKRHDAQSFKNKYESHQLPPNFTPVDVHTTSGASVVTIGDRPQVKGAKLGPVDLEFEITNPNREEMSLREIFVEVMDYEEACLLREIPYAGIGQTRRYICKVQPIVGQAFKCTSVEKGYDFIKLSQGELERFRVTVDASSGGLYRLAVTIRYSVGGKVTEIRVGSSDSLTFLGHGSTAVGLPHLIKALDDHDPIVRRDAALELCECLESHRRFGRQSWDTQVDDGSAFTLEGKPNDPRLLPILIATLEDPDGWMQEKAARFLGQIGDAAAVPALVESLRCGRLEREPIEALGKIGVAALPALSDLIQDDKASRRSSAVQAMSNIGAQAIPHLKTASSDPDERVRRAAAESLGKIGGDAVVDVLVTLLRDPADSVRATAATQLGQTRSAAAIDPLREALGTGNTRAAHALTYLRPPDVEGLMGALTSTELAVRLAATSAFGTLSWLFTKHPSATALGDILPELQKITLTALERAVADDSPQVRRSATAALKEIGIPAMSQLGLALHDEDGETCESAAWALAKIGSFALPTLISGLTGPNEAQGVLFRVFYRLGQPAIEALQHVSEHGDTQLRQAAAAMIERIAAQKASIARMLNEPEPERVPCEKCSALILPATAKKTSGLCMPCHKMELNDAS